ncbi:MAG: ATP-binding cassette domain-containing protein [Verrucomicrobia bacterium]|nr:ATP-binding cassette domain-containing protein [Verrucomicrobiota bacterium]
MDPLVIGENLTRSYGPTVPVNSVSFAIRRGTVTALLGANGAGKSTLTRPMSGGTRPDHGRLVFDSHPVSFPEYSVRRAKDLGNRVVHQELSVRTNLNAAEKFFLELSELFPGGPWRRQAGVFVLVVFGMAAWLCLTGVNTASDVNAASSYTFLSVAAVVMGGCDLVGGRIEPAGVVFAAVTLSLLGTLLGFMRLSSDDIAPVQGFLLIGIVILRTLWARPR